MEREKAEERDEGGGGEGGGGERGVSHTNTVTPAARRHSPVRNEISAPVSLITGVSLWRGGRYLVVPRVQDPRSAAAIGRKERRGELSVEGRKEH